MPTANNHHEVETPQPNAWTLPAARDCTFKVECADEGLAFSEVKPGDAMLLLDETGENAWGVRRVFLVRREKGKSIVYFDRFYDFDEDNSVDHIPGDAKVLRKIGMDILDSVLNNVQPGEPLTPKRPEASSRAPFSFEIFCALGAGDDSKGKVRRHIRELLETIVQDDLLGPAQGPEEEVVGSTVRARYIVGRLGPVKTLLESAEESSSDEDDSETEEEAKSETPTNEGNGDGADASEEESDESVADDLDTLKSNELTPSSMGMTFCIDASLPQIEVEVEWGKYTRETSETATKKDGSPLKCWKRHQMGGKFTLTLQEGQIPSVAPVTGEPKVVVTGIVSKPVGGTGTRPVTLFLANKQEKPVQNQDEAWLFQPVLKVRSPDGAAIFKKRPLPGLSENDTEMKTLDMIYRSKVEFAVGHNISVHVEPSAEDHERAVEIATVAMPHYEVPATEVPKIKDGDKDLDLDMRKVAAAIGNSEGDAIRNGVLGVIVKEYAKWIEARRAEAQSAGFDADYKVYADTNLDKCEKMLERLKEGIEILATDANARKAFAFANEVMADQRVHSIYALKRRQKKDEQTIAEIESVAANHLWRPFQIAFMLLALPPLANPAHKDRTEPVEAYADLLWFPTGGGKTEAYLGVAAFAMAIRRLQGNMGGLDASRGLCVIMRYTLRLLTIQQFQRAATLLCAMETRRKADAATWGAEPFTLGLWVGSNTTPNRHEESKRIIQRLKRGEGESGATPAQLKTCPWCGREINPKHDIDIHENAESHRTVLHCSDPHCVFSAAQSADGIPVLVVDEEMYHRPPSMMIATVDKFAQMASVGAVRMLFGRAETECDRHGLVLPDDDDCNGTHTKKGALPATHPKSVARIRPPDLIIQDEFHLISGPLGTMVGLYETAVDELCTWNLGDKAIHPKVIASTATVRKADEQIKRVFCRSCAVFPPSGIDVADNFFSRQDTTRSGRDYIGVSAPGSSRQEALIRTYAAFLAAGQNLFQSFGKLADPYMTVVGYFNSLRELGGMRRIADDSVSSLCRNIGSFNRVKRPGMARRNIPMIDELTSRVSSREIPAKLDQLETEFDPAWKKGDPRATDIVLATNMLSVGVDVNRLGLMIDNGQPKNTAEYIQATSRVGRSYPGVVCTVFAWARPRDFSHYEMFEHYHATFYKHVEAQSVTPFAKRALDRGLTGAFVSATRLADAACAPNAGAGEIKSTTDPRVVSAKEAFVQRAEGVMDSVDVGKWVKDELEQRIDNWVKEAGVGGRTLVYKKKGNSGGQFNLLKDAGKQAWDRQTVSTSLREVEGTVLLITDAEVLSHDQQNSHPWQERPAEEDGGGDGTEHSTTATQQEA